MRIRTLSFLLSLMSGVLIALCTATDGTFKFQLVRQNMIPTGVGVNFDGTVFGGSSVVKCSVSCINTGNVCRGFVFESSACSDRDRSSTSTTGQCQLVSFSDPTTLVFGPSTSDCQGFYVADPCWMTNPCFNGGTCKSSDWPRFCSCQRRYNGTYCENDHTMTTRDVSMTTSISYTSSARQETSTRVSPSTAMTSLQMSTTATIIRTACTINGTSVNIPRPRDCSDLRSLGFNTSGVYTIYIGTSLSPVSVYCDMSTMCGGWTVFQRRINGSIDFYRNWTEYSNGFGNPTGELWLGNDNLNGLTMGNGRQYKLRIDMAMTDGSTSYAEFDNFQVAAANQSYSLLQVGSYSGTAGDSLSHHVGWGFSTFDQDHGALPNCAQQYKGAWWYNACHLSNLNGIHNCLYDQSFATGIVWYAWTGFYSSLQVTEMKLRPNNV